MSDFNAFQCAAKAWPVLTRAAADRHTLTYGTLGKAIGVHHRPVRYVLSEIQDYCLREKLPPLTILVESGNGKVGKGFIAWEADDIEAGREMVYAESWPNYSNPFAFGLDGQTPDRIAAALAHMNITPQQAYARVKVRGMAQVVFRKTMLRVYGGRCAFSGDGGEPLMQAAHIVPWGKCAPEERLDPRNGLLLSTQHHRMFDLDWIRVTPEYRIQINSKVVAGHALSAPQWQALRAIDGQPIRLPAEARHHPSPSLLARRYSSKEMLGELRALEA